MPPTVIVLGHIAVVPQGIRYWDVREAWVMAMDVRWHRLSLWWSPQGPDTPWPSWPTPVTGPVQ